MPTIKALSSGVVRITVWVAVAALLACTVTVDSEGAAQTTALIDRIPAGATAIAWIDFEALEEVTPPERWQEYQDMLQNDADMEDLERFTEATGIDPRTDFKQFGVAVMPGESDETVAVMLLSLDYDRDRVMALLGDAQTVSYEGTTMYAMRDVVRNLEAAVQPDPDEAPNTEESAAEESFLAILDAQTIAIGSEQGVRVAIDVDAGRHDGLKMDPHMNDLINDVAGQGQVWLVASKESWSQQVQDMGDAGGMVPTGAIEGVEVLTMALRMGDGMRLRLSATASNAEDANLLAATLNGWVAMGKMTLQQSQPELFKILDRGISVTSSDRNIQIEADLTDADIEALQRIAAEQAQGSVIGG